MARQRTGALASLSNHSWPWLAMTPFAIDAEAGQFIIHISELAAHTRYLLQRPQASFMICTSETPGEPVHALPRASFQVRAIHPERAGAAWATARDCDLQRVPDVAFMVDFTEFHFCRLGVERARLVAGFGAARTISGEQVRQWPQPP